MTVFKTFRNYFFLALWKIKIIMFGLLTLLVIDAVAVAYFEKMSFADALYFTFVTGLTIGYGDITPVNPIGRIIAVLTGIQGLIITGIIVAVAVFALRKTMEQTKE